MKRKRERKLTKQNRSKVITENAREREREKKKGRKRRSAISKREQIQSKDFRERSTCEGDEEKTGRERRGIDRIKVGKRRVRERDNTWDKER